MSARRARPQASRLRRATATAAGDLSTPSPVAARRSVSSAHKIAPEPTPRSRMRKGSRRRPPTASARPRRGSLSPGADPGRRARPRGRGPRTRAVPRFLKRARLPPVRAANSVNRAAAAGSSAASGAEIRDAAESPAASRSASCASRRGSCSPAIERSRPASRAPRRGWRPRRRRARIKRPGRGSACTSYPTRTDIARFGRPVPTWPGSSGRVRRPPPRRRGRQTDGDGLVERPERKFVLAGRRIEMLELHRRRRLGLLEAHLDTRHLGDNRLMPLRDQLLKELERLGLVFVERVALRHAAPAYHLPQMVERHQMVAPR